MQERGECVQEGGEQCKGDEGVQEGGEHMQEGVNTCKRGNM